MSKAKQEAPRQQRQLCLGTTAVGALGIGLALVAIKIDATNNYRFGLDYMGQEAAYGLAAAASALAVVPMLATVATEGWNRIFRIVFWAAVGATVLAAINAYGVKQGAAIEAAKGAKDRYEQAQQDRDQARKDLAEAKAEAAAIAETVPAAELQKLFDDAKARRDAEANDPKRGATCGNICRKAEADMNAYSPRIAIARARDAALARAEKAQARIETAKAESSGGPKDQAPLAKAVASFTGTTAEKAAEQIALIMAGLMIILSVSAGMLFDGSFQIVRKGLGYGQVRPEPEPQPTVSAPVSVPVPTKLRLVSVTDRVGAFAAATFTTGIRISGSELYIRFEEWWLQNYRGERMPTPAELSKLLVEKGIQRKKMGGRMQYWLEDERAAA